MEITAIRSNAAIPYPLKDCSLVRRRVFCLLRPRALNGLLAFLRQAIFRWEVNLSVVLLVILVVILVILLRLLEVRRRLLRDLADLEYIGFGSRSSTIYLYHQTNSSTIYLYYQTNSSTIYLYYQTNSSTIFY